MSRRRKRGSRDPRRSLPAFPVEALEAARDGIAKRMGDAVFDRVRSQQYSDENLERVRQQIERDTLRRILDGGTP